MAGDRRVGRDGRPGAAARIQHRARGGQGGATEAERGHGQQGGASKPSFSIHSFSSISHLFSSIFGLKTRFHLVFHLFSIMFHHVPPVLHHLSQEEAVRNQNYELAGELKAEDRAVRTYRKRLETACFE